MTRAKKKREPQPEDIRVYENDAPLDRNAIVFGVCLGDPEAIADAARLPKEPPFEFEPVPDENDDDTPLTVGEVVREVGPPTRRPDTPAQALKRAEKALAGWVDKRKAAQKNVTKWRKEVAKRRRVVERNN